MRFSLRHLSPASWRIQIIAHNSALMMLRHGQCYPTDDEARTFPANFCTRYSQIPAWGGRIVFSPATRGLVTLLFGFCGGCDEPDELFGRDSLEDGSGLLHLASRRRTKLGNSSVASAVRCHGRRRVWRNCRHLPLHPFDGGDSRHLAPVYLSSPAYRGTF